MHNICPFVHLQTLEIGDSGTILSNKKSVVETNQRDPFGFLGGNCRFSDASNRYLTFVVKGAHDVETEEADHEGHGCLRREVIGINASGYSELPDG